MSLLDELLRKARAWCDARPGRRSELAKRLGWRLQELSSYLAEKPSRRPNAEKALSLAAFLAAQRSKSAATKPAQPAKPTRPVAVPTASRKDIYRAALATKR